MKRFSLTVPCFCICFVGLLNARVITEDYYTALEYSLTPSEDYFPTLYEEIVKIVSPIKKTTLTEVLTTTETPTSELSSETTPPVSSLASSDETPPPVSSLATTDETPPTVSSSYETPPPVSSSDETPPPVSSIASSDETSTTKILSTEGISTEVSVTSTDCPPVKTTKKSKIRTKGDWPEPTMYIVSKGENPEIIGLNIGLYYVLRDINKKLEKGDEITVKPLIRILALSEKIKKLGGRVHPRNQDLMKKIYGETLKSLINT